MPFNITRTGYFRHCVCSKESRSLLHVLILKKWLSFISLKVYIHWNYIIHIKWNILYVDPLNNWCSRHESVEFLNLSWTPESYIVITVTASLKMFLARCQHKKFTFARLKIPFTPGFTFMVFRCLLELYKAVQDIYCEWQTLNTLKQVEHLRLKKCRWHSYTSLFA